MSESTSLASYDFYHRTSEHVQDGIVVFHTENKHGMTHWCDGNLGCWWTREECEQMGWPKVTKEEALKINPHIHIPL